MLLAPVSLAQLPKSLSGGLRGTSRCYGGGFAKPVARNVENGKAPTFLRERFEIRLNENFDGLFAGVDLDSNGVVAKVHLVASYVFSSNDGVGHWGLALRDRRHRAAFDTPDPKETFDATKHG